MCTFVCAWECGSLPSSHKYFESFTFAGNKVECRLYGVTVWRCSVVVAHHRSTAVSSALLTDQASKMAQTTPFPSFPSILFLLHFPRLCFYGFAPKIHKIRDEPKRMWNSESGDKEWDDGRNGNGSGEDALECRIEQRTSEPKRLCQLSCCQILSSFRFGCVETL